MQWRNPPGVFLVVLMALALLAFLGMLVYMVLGDDPMPGSADENEPHYFSSYTAPLAHSLLRPAFTLLPAARWQPWQRRRWRSMQH